MKTITIIDGIGWKREHIAVFNNNERVFMDKNDNHPEFIKKIKKENEGAQIIETSCAPMYKEFIAINDFPNNLMDYYKNISKF